MNKVILIGRLVADPETVGSGTKFRLAVDKGFRVKEGNPTADYIPCVAFGNNASFAQKYLKKGTKIALEGHLQSGSYAGKEGKTIYTLDVVVGRMEFVESKASGNYSVSSQESYHSDPAQEGYTPPLPAEPTYPPTGGFALLEDEDESQLPF